MSDPRASERIYIIAEIGGNFRTLEEAKSLVDAAGNCGLDAVKLQTFRANTLASSAAEFHFEATGDVPQLELFRDYEISEALHREIFQYIDGKGLDWFSTPSHGDDLVLLESLGVGKYKIGSDDLTNLPFLEAVARTGKPVLLSTGMSTLPEVEEAVHTIQAHSSASLTLLHCTSSYPTRPEHVNLHAIGTLQKHFPGIPIGYSDHTTGITACLAAAALGAVVIEKHFTCDKTANGPDHCHSSDPGEMAALVTQLRELERMFGDGCKRPAPPELQSRLNTRKSLVLARSIPEGTVLDRSMLAVKRPGWGIPPKYIDQLIGRKAGKPLAEDAVLTWNDLA